MNALLLGSISSGGKPSYLHPTPAQILKLWHTHQTNVDPLLKNVHAPTLEEQILNAAINILSIHDHNLEALTFGIYPIAVLSIPPEECWLEFHATEEDLAARYQLGCQWALSACRLPLSITCLLAVVIRIAENMGIHNEAALKDHTPFEAEMCRRLWWSLVIFDTRTCELANSRVRTSNPVWDCQVSLNVGDHVFRPEMKSPPKFQECASDAIFVILVVMPRSTSTTSIRPQDLC